MESAQLFIILALIVLGAGIAFVLYTKRSSDALEDDPKAPSAKRTKADGADEGDAPSKVTTAKPIPPMR